MVCDPTSLYAYWDAPTGAAFDDSSGTDAQLVLRLHDVSDVTDKQLLEYVDYDCEGRARDGVMSEVIPGRSYETELGYHDAAGKWCSIARSNRVETPLAGPSQWEEGHFATIPWDQDLAGFVPPAELSQPVPEPVDPPREWIQQPPAPETAPREPATGPDRAKTDAPPVPEAAGDTAASEPASPQAAAPATEQAPARGGTEAATTAAVAPERHQPVENRPGGKREPGFAPRTREPTSQPPGQPLELQRIYLPEAVMSDPDKKARPADEDTTTLATAAPEAQPETRLDVAPDADVDDAAVAEPVVEQPALPDRAAGAQQTTVTHTEPARARTATSVRGHPSLRPLPFRGESVEGGPPSSAALAGDLYPDQPSSSGGEQSISSSSEHLHVPMAS